MIRARVVRSTGALWRLGWRRRGFTAATACCVGVLLASPAAWAFKEPGHRAIEAAAYRRELRTNPDVIPTLIRSGVLKFPYRPYPLPSSDLGQNFADYTVNGLLLQTGLADHLLDRQLQKDLQCFHFNARGSDVTKIHGQMFGVPRGLVVDAYVECVGVADAALRNILYSPQAANDSSLGMYTMIHMVEDSYSDAHVARTPDFKQIIYLKPWNLRTWTSYFFDGAGSPNDAVRLHFSDRHHMTSDTRDFGYVVGEMDTEGCLPVEDHECTVNEQARYRQRVKGCLADASHLLGYRATLDTLLGDVVVPESCLSDRGLAAVDAVANLLELVARHVEHVGLAGFGASVRTVAPVPCDFADDWLRYRKRFLAHVDPRLTETMSDFRVPLAADENDQPADVRRDFVYQSEELTPKRQKLAGAGISTELTPGTPIWLGFDAFVASDAGSHDKVGLFSALGYSVQVRLPIEDELGERPIGVAFDIGPGFPLPFSDLLALNKSRFDVFLGIRARVAYAAASVFQQNTRHVVEVGLGGVALDFVVGDWVWFGANFPRYMLHYDTWTNSVTYPLSWGFSGGIATNAF